MRIFLFHRNLLEHREFHFVGQAAELLNFRLGTRLLAEEVVGREPQHDEAVVAERFVQLLEALVLRRVAALRGRVDHQQYFAAKRILKIDHVVRGKAPKVPIQQIAVRGHRNIE